MLNIFSLYVLYNLLANTCRSASTTKVPHGAAPREDARAKNIGYAKSDQAQPDQCPAKLLSARSLYREKKRFITEKTLIFINA